MRPNIYISVPVTIDWTEVKKVVNRLASAGVSLDITYWNRQEKYSPSLVDDCDIFIFMPSDNTWKFNINTLPSGVKREYDRAVALDKPIFMVYKVMEGLYNLYAITKDGNTIQGVAGTSAVIWKTIRNVLDTPIKAANLYASNKNVVFNLEKLNDIALKPLTPSECVDYDPRLLL